IQRLHLRRPIVNDLDLLALRARLGDHPLQHPVLPRAPHVHLDAALALELGDECAQILVGHRGIKIDLLGGRKRRRQKKGGQSNFPVTADAQTPYRFCVMVSMSAGCPALTRLMARFKAAATAPGLSIGPSAYHPIDFASEAKSGAGLSMSMPMCARSTGVPRSFAMRIWCSQSL